MKSKGIEAEVKKIKCCFCIPFKIGMVLITIFTLFNNYVWIQTWRMLKGQIENKPDDFFADSKGAQIKPFVLTLLALSFIVTLLYLVWLCKDNATTRKLLVFANFVLFISAVLMVAGGDMVMIIDICLSIYWGFVTKKYMDAHSKMDTKLKYVP